MVSNKEKLAKVLSGELEKCKYCDTYRKKGDLIGNICNHCAIKILSKENKDFEKQLDLYKEVVNKYMNS